MYPASCVIGCAGEEKIPQFLFLPFYLTKHILISEYFRHVKYGREYYEEIVKPMDYFIPKTRKTSLINGEEITFEYFENKSRCTPFPDVSWLSVCPRGNASSMKVILILFSVLTFLMPAHWEKTLPEALYSRCWMLRWITEHECHLSF